jgi:hypothetical protein
MTRITLLTTIATIGVAAATPALAGPGGGNGGGMGGGLGNMVRGTVTGPASLGTTVRDTARANSRGPDNASPRALERANSNSVLGSDEAITGTRIPESATRGRSSARASARASTELSARSGIGTTASTGLTGVETGMTVNDSGGVAIGTVTGVTTKGNGSIRTVQVTLANGQIITLAPNGLTVDGDVLTTNSVTTNVNSQGATHASVNGLIHASPNSALASAGVTSLTGLATDLTVNNSVGDPLGTVGSIVVNRSGAVVGINLDLTAGGTVFVPATTLSMDGPIVVTSSTQF